MLLKLNTFIKTVQQDADILAIFLFGSTARNKNHKQSDIDICLMMRQGSYLPLEFSRKKLEYTKLFDLDVQIFQQLPLYIKIRVIREGKNLFCANDDELYQIVFRTITEFEDFKQIYRDYLKEVGNVR
ncbi:MAG: nucleotidyltransferase domain-containing protein [Candidatus Omnitrophica bacterium]|nr:nucleotidyltransferase domain-containing protein [Candidatus Omnitrophota bacterium]